MGRGGNGGEPNDEHPFWFFGRENIETKNEEREKNWNKKLGRYTTKVPTFVKIQIVRIK